MPVPKPQDEVAPRRLLRDVVFDRMLAAILDGTLEPGERLNDDELVTWLGVSRTPIREAIARLNTWGLVELEANRYTRIATVSREAFVEASTFLAGLHNLAAGWVESKPSATLKKQFKSARESLAARDPQGIHDLLDAYGTLVSETGNALFIETELPIRTRVKFLSPKDPEAYDWDELDERAETLARRLS